MAMLESRKVVQQVGDRLWFHQSFYYSSWFDRGWLSYSDDKGVTWQNIFTPVPTARHYNYGEGFSYGVELEIDQALFIDDQNGTVNKSKDNGKTWQIALSPDGKTLEKLVEVPAWQSILAISSKEIFVIPDDTSNWNSLKTFTDQITNIVPVANSLWVTTVNDLRLTVYNSKDRGITWQNQEVELSEYYYHGQPMHCALTTCVSVYDSSEIIYLINEDENLQVIQAVFGLHVETDSGSEFEEFQIDDFFWASSTKTLWVLSDYELYQSTDYGQSWSRYKVPGYIHNWDLLKPPDNSNAVVLTHQKPEGNSSLSTLVQNNGNWAKHGMIPDVYNHNSIDITPKICWLNNTKAVLQDYSEDHDYLYYVTADAGKNWYPITLQTDTPYCIISQSKLRVGDSLIRFK